VKAPASFGFAALPNYPEYERSAEQLSEKTYRFPQAGIRPQSVPGAIVHAGNASLIPAYLLSLSIQMQTTVDQLFTVALTEKES
jgi:hypothetical protein